VRRGRYIQIQFQTLEQVFHTALASAPPEKNRIATQHTSWFRFRLLGEFSIWNFSGVQFEGLEGGEERKRKSRSVRMKELIDTFYKRICDEEDGFTEELSTELLALSQEVANREYFATFTTEAEGFRSSILGALICVVLPKLQDAHAPAITTLLQTLTNAANNPVNRKELCSDEFHLLELLAQMLTKNISRTVDNSIDSEITDLVCASILELLQTLGLDEANKAVMVQMESFLGVLIDILGKSKSLSRNLKNKTGMLLGSLCLHATNRDLILELPVSLFEALFGVIKECSADTSEAPSSSVIELCKEGSVNAVWTLRSFSLSRRISMTFATRTDDLQLLFQAAHGPLRSPKLVEHLIQICMNMALCGSEGVSAILDAGVVSFLNRLLKENTGTSVKKWKSNAKRALLVLLNCACFSKGNPVFRDEFLQVILAILDDTTNSPTAPEVKHCYLLLCIFCGQRGVVGSDAEELLFTKYPSLLSIFEEILQIAISDVCSVGVVTRRKDYTPLRAVLCGLLNLSMHDGNRSIITSAAWLPAALSKLLNLYTKKEKNNISADVLSSDVDERVCGVEECANAVSVIARVAIDFDDAAKLQEYLSSSGGDLLAVLEKISTSTGFVEGDSRTESLLGFDTMQLASIVVSLCVIHEHISETKYSFKPQSIFLSTAYHSLDVPNDARASLASNVIELTSETNRYVATDCAFRGASGSQRQSLNDTVEEMLSCDYLIFVVSNISQFDSFGRILSKRYLSASKKPRLLLILEEGVEQLSITEWLQRMQETPNMIQTADKTEFHLSGTYDSWNLVQIIQNVFAQEEGSAEEITPTVQDTIAEVDAQSLQSVVGTIQKQLFLSAEEDKLAKIRADAAADAKTLYETELAVAIRQTVVNTVVGAILETASQCCAKETVDRARVVSEFSSRMAALESSAQDNATTKDLETSSLRSQLDKISEENIFLRLQQHDAFEEMRIAEPVSSLHSATPPPRQLKPVVASPRNSGLVGSYHDTPATSSSPLTSSSRIDVSIDPLDYITNPQKCVDPSAMSSLLEEMGISELAELALCDASDIHAITMLLKPIPRKLFLKEMSQLHI